jgi:IS6 family transposase
MAERNLHVDHVTIWRSVQHYAPELAKRCRRELRRTGEWTRLICGWPANGPIYIARSIPRETRSISWSYRKVIAELKVSGELGRRCQYRPVPYLNNILEQDHRSIKRASSSQPRIPVL